MASFGIRFVIGIVLGGLSQALTPKPPKPQSPIHPVTSNTFTVRQSDATRKHVYGMTRISDVFAQIVASGANQKLHAVIILCDDEVESIDEVWVNDDVIPNDYLDGDGNVTQGKYAGYLRIRKHLGSPSQAADSKMVAEVEGWTASCKLSGITYLYVTLTKNQNVYPNGMPNFSAIVKGRKIYDPRLDQSRWTPNGILFAYDYLALADFGYTSPASHIDLANITAEANIADEIVDTQAVDMTVASIDTATDIITVSGGRLLFELGDRVSVLSNVSPPTLPGGLSESADYYVIPYQIKGSPAYGTTAATEPRLKLAASLSDAIDGIAVDITSSGSNTLTVRKTGEPRYHGAGILDTANTLEQGLQSMLASCGGRAANTGGLWRLISGAWRAPTVEFGINDFRGAMGTRTKIAMADRFNTIQGLYVSSLNDYQSSNYPSVRNQDFIDEDNGMEYPHQLDLNFTNRPTTAKRIAKLELLRARQEMTLTVPLSLAGMQVQAGDNVTLTVDRRGWSSKAFEVTEFGFSVGGGDNPQLLTNLTFRETSEDIYAWASATDDPSIDPAPNSSLPDPFTVNAPTGIAYSSRAANTAGGDAIYNLVLMWDAPDNAFITDGGRFEIQYKLSSDETWRPSFFIDGSLTEADLLSSSVNVSYDLRIRAVNNLGVRSNWETLEGAIVGYSGGVGTTNDWGSVADAVGTTNDWGSVADTVGTTNDWGSVV